MANEAVKIVQGNISPRRMTCASGTAIAKGAFLMLSDPVTCALATGTHPVVAGFATSEKSATDLSTSIGVDTSGIFDLVAGEAIAVGALVAMSGSNVIMNANATDLLSGCLLGKCLEAASAGEVVAVEVGRVI